MAEKKLKKVRRWFRSAITGRFVSTKRAAENKDTTTEETYRPNEDR